MELKAGVLMSIYLSNFSLKKHHFSFCPEKQRGLKKQYEVYWLFQLIIQKAKIYAGIFSGNQQNLICVLALIELFNISNILQYSKYFMLHREINVL